MSALSAIDAVLATCTDEVRAGGFWFRVRRVTNDDVAQRRVALLLMVAPRSAEDQAAEEDVANLPEEARPQALARLRFDRFRRSLELDPERAHSLKRTRPGIIAAGVTHISLDRENWDAVELVWDEAAEDRTATPARLYRGRFNDTTLDTLFEAIWSLCTDGGAAAERIEAFRRRAGDVRAP